MIAALGGWLTPTRATGMASFGCAAVASGIAWAKLARESGRFFGPRAKLPRILMLVHSFLFLDMIFNWRWQMHDVLQGAAISERVYARRALPQELALFVLGVGFVALCAIVIRSRWNQWGALAALLATGLGMMSWCMEIISLHGVDRVLYQSQGSFMPVVLIWILVGLFTSAGITSYAHTTSIAEASRT